MKIDHRIFHTVLMSLDFIAAAVWAFHGDVKKSIYWIAAGVLTLTVTW